MNESQRDWEGERSRNPPRVALVLWNGQIGGAETLSVGVAAAMRRLGVIAEVVLIGPSGPLADRLDEAGVPFRALGFSRGREILLRPRAYAAAVGLSGRDGAVLPECGFVGAALRLGGFRAPILAVEHGTLLQRSVSVRRRIVRQVNRLAGAWADDVEVGVSDFVVDRMRHGPHARVLDRVYNGIEPERFKAAEPPEAFASEAPRTVGFAGRLIPGKGADDAIAAIVQASRRTELRLLIAGDGPERSSLRALAGRLGAADSVQFLGLVDDMPAFWQECDMAIFPSHQFVESFGMAAIEAMACGKPVVATRNGAAPELVADGVTGTIVAPGDVAGLAQALAAYAEREELRRAHGAAGRERAGELFHIDDCARAYLRHLGLVSFAG